jgi:hypothetical protein
VKKSFVKIGLVEWLKVKALSSSPSTAPPKKEVGRCCGKWGSDLREPFSQVEELSLS